MNRRNGIKNHVSGLLVPLFVICMLASFVAGCGGGGSDQTGGTHAITAAVPFARVTGMVLLQNADAALGRAKGETVAETAGGRSTERAAAQISPCGAVPAGYVAVPNAAISVLNETGSTVTDDNGCFEMNIYNMGIKIFTATKTNALGGTTILKKAADVQPDTHVKFIDGERGPMTVMSTVTALIVAEKDKNGETIPDPEDVEAYIESIEDQDDVAGLCAAITAAAQPGGNIEDIEVSDISDVEATTDAPVIYSPTITGSPVAYAGGAVQISVNAAAFGDGVTLQAVTAILTASGQAPIEITLTAGANNVYSTTYTFAQNAVATAVIYSVIFEAVDSNSVESTSAPAGLTITQSAVIAVCGNGAQETGETCDDSNAVTETCAYGQTSCTVCNATCQSVAGALTGYCSDSTTQGGSGEACDDGNTATEVCVYGQTSCTVCDAMCQSVAGATNYCGDTTTDAGDGEACDDGNTATEVCVYGQTSCTVCNATCQSAAGALTGYCGDGTTQGGNGEGCDDSNTATEVCVYGQTSCTVCNATCQSAAGVLTGYCGDSTVQAGNGEACDDGGTAAADGCSATCQTEPLFVLVQSVGSNQYSMDFAVGDFDSDGDVDYFSTSYGSETHVFFNNGTGAFTVSGTAYGTIYNNGCVEADFDGDSDIDIALGQNGQQSKMWVNNGSGVFTQANLWGGSGTYSIAKGDLNGDGDIDVIVGESNGALVYSNDGSAVLTNTQTIGAGLTISGIAIGDVDGDGDRDAVLGGYEGDSTVVWLNNGAGVFSDSGQTLGNTDVGDVQLADFDADGDLDLVQANYTEETVLIWTNNGSGVFTNSGQSFLGAAGTDRVVVGDFDLDGDLDIVMGVRRAPDFVLLNNGAGTFTQSPSFGSAEDAIGLRTADIDADGDLDLIMGGGYPQDYIWKNTTN